MNDDLAKRVAHRYSGSKAVALNQDFWLTPEDVAQVCPPCAERMASLKIRKIRASVIFRQDMLRLACEQAATWKDLPEGWTDEARRKFWASIGGSNAKCAEKVAGHVTDPEAFCAALAARIGEPQP